MNLEPLAAEEALNFLKEQAARVAEEAGDEERDALVSTIITFRLNGHQAAVMTGVLATASSALAIGPEQREEILNLMGSLWSQFADQLSRPKNAVSYSKALDRIKAQRRR